MTGSRSNTEHAESTGRSTSRSLIDRLKRDEAIAWRELVHLYSPLIFHWCQQRGLRSQECADILQDAFRSVVGNIREFRKEEAGDTFRGWLRTITHNKINDHLRRTAGEPRAVGGTDAELRLGQVAEASDELLGDDDDATAERTLFLRAIEMIRKDFQDQTWQAFWRVVVDGRSAQEVGDELGMRPGTVRVAKSRVLKRLREQLGDAE
jgi:RNA polymerase sigma-70 factor (ECF subfamily)